MLYTLIFLLHTDPLLIQSINNKNKTKWNGMQSTNNKIDQKSEKLL